MYKVKSEGKSLILVKGRAEVEIARAKDPDTLLEKALESGETYGIELESAIYPDKEEEEEPVTAKKKTATATKPAQVKGKKPAQVKTPEPLVEVTIEEDQPATPTKKTKPAQTKAKPKPAQEEREVAPKFTPIPVPSSLVDTYQAFAHIVTLCCSDVIPTEEMEEEDIAELGKGCKQAGCTLADMKMCRWMIQESNKRQETPTHESLLALGKEYKDARKEAIALLTGKEDKKKK